MKKKNHLSTESLFKVFVFVALITFAISIIVPVAWVFLASIKENHEFYGNPWTLPEGFYWQNFVEAFFEANMGQYFMNSILVTFTALAILLMVALPASYVLARYEFRGRAFLRNLVRAGLFINISYIVVPIFLMLLEWDGVARNLTGNPIFLNNRFILALIYAATALPFTILLLSSYFETLPRDFEEAASIDGAGQFRTMFSVMIPMARPSIITVILFNFMSFWNEYILALTLMPAGNYTLPVGLNNLMAAERAAANYGRLYAGMVIVMLPTLILYIMVQRRLTEGMTAGGVKG